MQIKPKTDIHTYLKGSWFKGQVTAGNAIADGSGNGNMLISSVGGTSVIALKPSGYGARWTSTPSLGEALVDMPISATGQSWVAFIRCNIVDGEVGDSGTGGLFGDAVASADTPGIRLFFSGSSHKMTFRWDDNSDVQHDLASDLDIPLKTPFTLVVVRDAVENELSLYIDGTKDATLYEQSADIKASSTAFNWGGWFYRSGTADFSDLFNSGVARNKDITTFDMYLPPVGTVVDTVKDTIAAQLHKYPTEYLPDSIWTA